MRLERMRRAAVPATRSIRSSFAAVLLVLAVSFGLLAMHDTAGGDHSGHGSSTARSAASAGGSDDHATHAAADHADHTEPASTALAAAGVAEGAGSSTPACAIADPTCAMTAAAPATTALASAPDEHPRSGPAVLEEPRGIRLGFVALPPPDLHLLSISRT